ncbi:phosphonate C-P lyase system protein PhnG [Sporosarcina sp. G11-34]|uniref:phosphonate C-P lyase system protein PhnG n=1 Tax=Sporosarcina sp. G11-34 TaxID=2849605 RepID=UPI0022A8E764|nr:phosphonate C-P lyase system protein PhnG [Sporosarcina sp. G11-34]MCZ2259164.1 phosphonate C-P lyase system protein PhnG [Sporosarcina sp. G11-34]
MNRRKRTEILIDGSPKFVNELASEIERNYDIHILSKPQHALTMIKMRETAKNSLFYLGEVLVTETKVQINNKLGIGVVVGNEEQLSYELAVIDAAYQGNLVETIHWTFLFEEEEKRIHENRKKKEASILKTKVNFEMMDV